MDERKMMVLAMEFIARHINDEEVFSGWLMNGVADGDIPYGSFDPNDVDDYYTDAENLKDLTECFLNKMKAASKYGGLWFN